MSAIYVSVQVPEQDVDDLMTLIGRLGDNSIKPMSAHPFDGALLMQIVLPLSGLSAAVLRTWIAARKESRKSMRVIVDGTEISGYTAGEVGKILGSLSETETDLAGNQDKIQP